MKETGGGEAARPPNSIPSRQGKPGTSSGSQSGAGWKDGDGLPVWGYSGVFIIRGAVALESSPRERAKGRCSIGEALAFREATAT
jgi:hypothetical protein